MWINLDLDDVAMMMALATLWVAIGATWIAAIARRLMIQRRAEWVYRVRLAQWRATANSA